MIPIKGQCILTREELDERCLYWQSILRLQDWDVVVKLERGNGLSLPTGMQGRCEWSLKRRSAVIQIMDSVDWDSTYIHPQDHEVTLVHELLHLQCAPFDRFKEDDPDDIALEQMLVANSNALVHLDRQAKAQ